SHQQINLSCCAGSFGGAGGAGAELNCVGPRRWRRCWRRCAWPRPVKDDTALVAVEAINLDTVGGPGRDGESYQALNVARRWIVEWRDVVVGSENSQRVDGGACVGGQNRVEAASVGIECCLACSRCCPVIPDRSATARSRRIGWFSRFLRRKSTGAVNRSRVAAKHLRIGEVVVGRRRRSDNRKAEGVDRVLIVGRHRVTLAAGDGRIHDADKNATLFIRLPMTALISVAADGH